MHSYTPADIRPVWEPRPYSQNQANLIKTIMEERGITAAQLFETFPERPTSFHEGSKVISWLKSQPVATAPAQPSTPQGVLPVRLDKHGKPMYSYYAIDLDDTVKFYRVKPGRKPGFYFVDAQGSDEFYSIRNANVKAAIIKAIVAQGPEKAQRRYGQEIGKCGHCGRTLTDAESRAYGIGPICREG